MFLHLPRALRVLSPYSNRAWSILSGPKNHLEALKYAIKTLQVGQNKKHSEFCWFLSLLPESENIEPIISCDGIIHSASGDSEIAAKIVKSTENLVFSILKMEHQEKLPYQNGSITGNTCKLQESLLEKYKTCFQRRLREYQPHERILLERNACTVSSFVHLVLRNFDVLSLEQAERLSQSEALVVMNTVLGFVFKGSGMHLVSKIRRMKSPVGTTDMETDIDIDTEEGAEPQDYVVTLEGDNTGHLAYISYDDGEESDLFECWEAAGVRAGIRFTIKEFQFWYATPSLVSAPTAVPTCSAWIQVDKQKLCFETPSAAQPTLESIVMLRDKVLSFCECVQMQATVGRIGKK